MAFSHSDLRMMVLVAGTTIPAVRARRGDFADWIRVQTGTAWKGGWLARDVRGMPYLPVLPGPRDADAFIVTGSSSSVTERAPWIVRLEQLVRDIVAARRPLLGICFGHQVLAQALGGEVARNPSGREIGTVGIRRLADASPLFEGVPRLFDVHATHVDTVVRLPRAAERLAVSALDAAAAFRFGDRAYAVQFHPEFDRDIMRGYVAARRHLIVAEGGDPDALLARIHDGTRGRDILRSFARWAEQQLPT